VLPEIAPGVLGGVPLPPEVVIVFVLAELLPQLLYAVTLSVKVTLQLLTVTEIEFVPCPLLIVAYDGEIVHS